MKSIVDAIYFRRHFWHRVRLNELSELYISLTLRALGMSLIGIFVPVYLYQQGFSIQNIATLFAAMYGLRLFTDPLIGKLVARFGPKHLLRASFPVEVIYIISIIAAGNNIWPLWTVAVAFAVAVSMFMIPFHADFSNVENVKHIGRQLSTMTILEKVAGALGPLAGGLIAAKYGFEVAVVVALVVTILAAVPLYATGEYGGYRVYRYKLKAEHYDDLGSDVAPLVGRGFGIAVASFLWPLLIVLNVFETEAYAGLGLVTALGLGSTMLTAHLVGRLVDNNKGRELLRYGTWLSMFSHVTKPIITSVSGAIGISIAGESLDSLHRLPYMKGFYSNADTYKHGRVAYVIAGISMMHVARFFTFGSVAILTYFYTDITALSTVTVLASLATLLMLAEKFKALDK